MPSSASNGSGVSPPPFNLREAAFWMVSIRSVDLPPPETPVTAVKQPSGIDAVTFFRLLPRAPRTVSWRRLSILRRSGRQRDCALARKILAREAFRMRHDFRWRPFRDDVAAMHARARPDIDDMVGRKDRVFVVLDHQHRIAEVAQVLQRREQPRIVALVQADGWLVQHVEHAGQPGADLRGKPDALAFAARQRAGIAGERQIIETDIVEEAQALADFLEDARGDFVLLARELPRQRREPIVCRAD